ncbi:MAG: right-handed parallel beta-helix repeat-containing protein [Candidatus Zixiibacteriota bacterium]|nr:MAG: right-handed parallel beta-helix repeat-containing protein [candidate division Zixibacteria bacterium]
MKKIICLIMILWMAAFSSATIIHIPADYPTIQQGINASADGDTVLVQPGTYVENLVLDSVNVTLGSLFLITEDTSYITTTIIDGDSSDAVVTFLHNIDSTACITGFTIQNGFSNSTGAGIVCRYGASPTISSNLIKDNISSGCSGVLSLQSNPVIANNTIINNRGDEGIGICSINPDGQIIVNNIISNNEDWNQGGHGGGIYVYSGVNLTLSNNIISQNEIYECGAIYIQSSDGIINNNLVTYNISSIGGAIAVQSSMLEIYNNTFSNNYSEYEVGGFAVRETSSVVFYNNICWGDSSLFPYGAKEIWVDDLSYIQSSYNNIQDTLWPGVGNLSVDPLFCDPGNGDFHLMFMLCDDTLDSPCIDAGDPDIADSLLDCSWGLGGWRSDMGAYGGGGDLSDLCQYVVGDANNSGEFNGLDVIYGVAYFKGGLPPPYECECTPGNVWYVAGDVNASCNYNGLDITYAVAYFKGGSHPEPCADCPPAN